MMRGRLTGVGTGPGDPELLTLKALRKIREADVIAVPGECPKESVAYRIVQGAYPQIAEKELLAVPMPMIYKKAELEAAHEEAARQIQSRLDQGEDVVFLTLGDPVIYSTYLYIHKRITCLGYETEIVNGIPSFCAAAARRNTGLVEGTQMLHIIPASAQIEGAIELEGTKVFMKSGKKLAKVKEKLHQAGAEAWMVENCGMTGEKVYRTLDEIPQEAGYYSLIVARDASDHGSDR